MSTVQSLINDVSQKINALETAQALYSRQLSPDFSTFDYINTDELGLVVFWRLCLILKEVMLSKKAF
ncbi:hypothetical protein [Psychrobacter sp. JCM 18901]|uniref:hypothetical protein n=1 Tax=Psychrobacter sp. JCM 18901 TaxID=1298609 RepID=UPI0004B03F98|nr:hypothetical protein [Psychrobacter sp. JCM 18901]